MAEALGLFALGVLALALGGDSVVKGISGLSQQLGMRPFVAGLVLLAFGTSVPELAVNLRAVWQQQPHLALGNAVGSKVVNLGLALGLAAMAAPLDAGASAGAGTGISCWPVAIWSSAERNCE